MLKGLTKLELSNWKKYLMIIKSYLKSFLRSMYLSRPLKQFRQLTSFLKTVILSMTPIQSQSLKSRPCRNGMHSVSITNIVAERTRPLGLCMGFKMVLNRKIVGNGRHLTNQRKPSIWKPAWDFRKPGDICNNVSMSSLCFLHFFEISTFSLRFI